MNDRHKNTTSEALAFTGERFVPEIQGNIELEHLHRYRLACKVVEGKAVLDIASGEGYGSAMLARAALKVTGVDISQEAISHAQAKYQSKNLEFHLGSCSAIPLGDASVDVVVSFETIEHHDDHEVMMREIKRVLRPGGVLVISSPDKLEYSDKPGYSNPYHVKELYRDEFKKLLDLHFKNYRIYGQRVVYGSAIFCEDGACPVESYALVDDVLQAIPGVSHAVYLVAVASDEELPVIESGMLEQPIEESDAVRGQLANLNQTVAERDGQLASLNRAMAERDGQLASLNRAMAERDGQLASLNRAMVERDGQIANLNQAVAERDARLVASAHNLESVSQQLQAVHLRIHGMEQSRSWRMTAPYRWLGRVVKGGMTTVGQTGVLSRFVVALLLMPAALVFYEGLLPLFRELRSGGGPYGKVIAGQVVIRERLLSRSRMLRSFVFASFSLAVRIQRAGSVKRSLGNFLRIVCAEGLGGLRGRMITTVPGMAAAPVQVREGRPAELPVLAKEVARRILVADYRVPRPDVSAGDRAMRGILTDLATIGYEVVLLPIDMSFSEGCSAPLIAAGVRIVTRESGFRYPQHYLNKHGAEFGVFFISRVDVAEQLLPVARRVAPDARIIFHAPDLNFLREIREAEVHNDTVARERALQTCDRERAMMAQSDRVVLISPVEVPVLREVLPDTPISIFPGLYASVKVNPRSYAERKNIFFLGGFAHRPNVNAVLWFAAEVWPHVCEALPKVEFDIIGAEAPDSVVALGKLPGIKVVGFVPDLDPVLETLRVGVAPMQYGAGIKGKVAVTMGAGIPCVCTEIAAEGMGIKNDVHALVEDDPVRFAQAIVRLYEDETTWSRLARNGQSLVQCKFSDAANRTSLLKVLDEAQALPIPLFCEYCQAADPVVVPSPDAQVAVDVSIIVPVYNKWDLTRACITSVVQTSMGSGVCYEIILADDGSTDDTLRAAELFPGLRIVKTPKNLGFLRNCNNAARHARGRHILLLNNDTVVLPGWLEALHKTIESDSSIAIVGSKLLYPDGLIQEAGAVLFKNGTAINVGRGFRRFTEVFNLQREVDYISAASILIRKSFWDSVGGFDARYKVAYCEDCDLAMTARSVGMRVVYEPSSEIVHFEHQSYAEQAPSHNATLQNHNIAILLEKWKDVFETDHLPVCDWQLAASRAERHIAKKTRIRRGSGKFNILYFSPFPSHPASHGNRAIINQLARHFQNMGHTVHFVLLQSHEYAESDIEEMRATWDTLDVIPYTNPMIADGRPIPFDGWYEEGIGERIRSLCAQYDIDVVFCSYVFQSKLLEFVPSYMLKVIDTHDKMGDRYEMLRINGQPPEFFSCTQEEEGAYLRRADVVVALREEEARYFDMVTGKHTAVVISHAEAPRFISKDFTNVRQVGMVASANSINLAMMHECLAAIERRLQGADCTFTVHIAGQVKEMVGRLQAKENAVFRKPWVRMHGFVHNITEFYADMDMILSPVTMGTGINVKTVQAMAYGMPVLTTECGSKGIETGDPMHTHTDLEALVVSLFSIVEHPQELRRLAALSRECYDRFYDESVKAVTALFAHPKLVETRDESRASKNHSN